MHEDVHIVCVCVLASKVTRKEGIAVWVLKPLNWYCLKVIKPREGIKLCYDILKLVFKCIHYSGLNSTFSSTQTQQLYSALIAQVHLLKAVILCLKTKTFFKEQEPVGTLFITSFWPWAPLSSYWVTCKWSYYKGIKNNLVLYNILTVFFSPQIVSRIYQYWVHVLKILHTAEQWPVWAELQITFHCFDTKSTK